MCHYLIKKEKRRLYTVIHGTMFVDGNWYSYKTESANLKNHSTGKYVYGIREFLLCVHKRMESKDCHVVDLNFILPNNIQRRNDVSE